MWFGLILVPFGKGGLLLKVVDEGDPFLDFLNGHIGYSLQQVLVRVTCVQNKGFEYLLHLELLIQKKASPCGCADREARYPT